MTQRVKKRDPVEGEGSINLDPNVAEATFYLNGIGAKTRTTYNGAFKVRTLLDPTRVLAAGRDYRHYLGPYGSAATDHEINLAFAISQLNHRLIMAPPWWNSTEGSFIPSVTDANVILAALDLAIRSEELYDDAVTARSQELEKRLSDTIRAKDAAFAKAAAEEPETLPEENKTKVGKTK